MSENHNTAKSAEPKSHINIGRWLKNLVRSVVYLPLLILVIFAILVATPFGSHLSIIIADKFVPGLSVDYVDGTLNDQISLENIRWENTNVKVKLNDATLNWRPWCLFKAEVCVDTLRASQINVAINTENTDTQNTVSSSPNSENSTPSKTSAADYQLKLPVSIVLGNAQLNSIDVTVNKMRYQADDISLQADWKASGLNVHRLVAKSVSLDFGENVQQTTEVNNRWPLANLPNVTLPFPIDVDMARVEHTQLKIAGSSEAFPLVVLLGKAKKHHIDLDQLTVVHSLGAVSIKGQADLTEDYPVDLQAQVSLETLPGSSENIVQDGQISIKGDFSKLNIDADLHGTQTAKISGNIDLSDKQLPYHINLTDGQLQWPFNEPQYQAKSLTFSSQGSLIHQHATLTGKLFSPYVEAVDVDGSIQHQHQQLDLTDLHVNTSAGNIVLNGLLKYGKSISWQLKTQVAHLDLANIQLVKHVDSQSTKAKQAAWRLPDSDISGPITSSGEFVNGKWRVQVDNVALSGKADQLPFNLSGDANINSDLKLHTTGLSLNALNSRFFIQGNAGETWDLHGNVNVPDIAQWLPDGYGNLSAKLSVDGSSEQPNINLNGTLLTAGWNGYKIEKVEIVGHYQPLNKHQFDVNLSSGDISIQQRLLGQLSASLKGDIDQQQFSVALAGENGISITGENRYQAKGHSIQLSLNSISTTGQAGHWQLEKPVNFAWQQTTGKGSISPFCLVSKDNQLCLQNKVDLQHPKFTIDYQGQPSSALSAFLPDGLQWQGNASMTAEINLPSGAKPTATAELNFDAGSVTYTQQTKNSETVQYQAGKIIATLTEDKLHSEIDLDAGDLAKVNANLDVSTDPQHALSGSVQLQRFNLKFFEQVIPQFQTLEGLLTSDVTLSGTLKQPLINGNAELTQGAVVLSTNPTQVNDLHVTANFNGQNMELAGNWSMGKGTASASGNLSWETGKTTGEITVQGDKLTVIQPPLAILNVSPKLKIAFGDTLHIGGDVDIPSGSITITQLPAGGVSRSQDVVFDDTLSAQNTKQASTPVTADININIGDKLKIDGYGLKSLLNGTLNLQQNPGKPAQLYGNINLKDGTYKFMSQTLTISQGQLQFIGPPTVPTLNIEAIREIKDEDMVAGIRITGTAKNPQVTLFSNPTKEQAEILSYILQGKGYDSSEDNSSMMIGAAISLGGQFSGGSSTMGNISNTAAGLVEMFGFNNVQLDTDNEGRVAISGYVGKDLMLKYGVGVFTPGYEVTVRYYLLSQLYLESVSSTVGQSLDIYYTFDIDN